MRCSGCSTRGRWRVPSSPTSGAASSTGCSARTGGRTPTRCGSTAFRPTSASASATCSTADSSCRCRTSASTGPIPPQDGVDVDAQPTGGATGRRALRVDFVNKRWAGPPVQQYLMLLPGVTGSRVAAGRTGWRRGSGCSGASTACPTAAPSRGSSPAAAASWRRPTGRPGATISPCPATAGTGAAAGTRQPAPRRRHARQCCGAAARHRLVRRFSGPQP